MAINPAASASGYQAGGGGAAHGVANAPETKGPGDYWPLTKCKRAYLDYLSSKRLEIDEQQEARRYRHGAHWTSAQVEALNKRKQPVVTYNRIGRKIDGIVGLVEKLRQDPKAYPRTPKHEEGADLATAVLRYALESQDWVAKSSLCAESAAVDGIGGVELELIDGDQGDRDVGFEVVDTDGFFYDPRSFRMDFSDATYMGMGKWLDPEVAKELIPGKEKEIDDSIGDNSDLTSNSDRDDKWFFSDGDRKRIRLVDIWYRHKGKWCWALFTGSSILMEGESYFVDEKKKTICKFIMFSAAVDHDGDRYGFVRNLKSANDEINQRRSKGLHELNTRRVIAKTGHFTDVELARREAARPDGFLLWNMQGQADEGPNFDDAKKQSDIVGQLKFLEDAKAEIENFGPNPALIGTGVNAKSGRAISLMQQAGIAELGPYIVSNKGWKLRFYRGVYNAIQTNWTAERWIRVTDNEGVAQFVQINGMQTDPQTGMPTMVNAIGQLDVDILLDEGPDTVTMMQDFYETLRDVMPSIAPMLTPEMAQAAVSMLIDVSPISSEQKKGFRDASKKAAEPNPVQQQMQQIAVAGAEAEVKETESKALLNVAKARREGMPDPMQLQEPQEFELPPEIQIAQAVVEIDATRAGAEQKRAAARKSDTDVMLAPVQMAQERQDRRDDRAVQVAFKGADMRAADADRSMNARNADADRKIAARKAVQRPTNGSR